MVAANILVIKLWLLLRAGIGLANYYSYYKAFTRIYHMFDVSCHVVCRVGWNTNNAFAFCTVEKPHNSLSSRYVLSINTRKHVSNEMWVAISVHPIRNKIPIIIPLLLLSLLLPLLSWFQFEFFENENSGAVVGDTQCESKTTAIICVDAKLCSVHV